MLSMALIDRCRTSAPTDHASPPSPKSACVVLDLPALPAQDFDEDIDDLESRHKAAFHDEEAAPTKTALTRAPSNSVLLKPRKVTLEQAQIWLQTFRHMSRWFPFVVISPESTVSSLSRDSPFILLAILTVTAKSDVNYYFQLDHEFRRILSQRLVVDGHKTLELLQGLLIYLAWYVLLT